MKKALVLKQIDQLCTHQPKKLALCAGHLACNIQEHLSDARGWRAHVTYAEETKSLVRCEISKTHRRILSKMPFSS
jgi:NDP-sugar pyrophosphorylase family protein